jgi:NADPH:quinone reductase-like Zn-dependent oxidoreductase
MVNTRYGSPDIFELREVETPIPKKNEVLIKVHAVAINDWDWGIIEGKQIAIRLLYGLRKPKVSILGCDVAGRIVAIGNEVVRCKPGDDVFGDLCVSGFGGFAEYVCASEEALAVKPPDMTYEQAAAIPQAGAIAIQGLVDLGGIRSGHQILINGAGGGVGTFGIQLAKLWDVEVTGVDNTEKQDFLQSMGFDHVLDYTSVDFTRAGKQYDLILDTKTNRSPFDYARALKRDGVYVTVGGSMSRILSCLSMAPLIGLVQKKRIRVLALKPNKDVRFLAELFESGKLKPIIELYTLGEIKTAFRRFAAAEHMGKIVLTVASD